LVEVIFFNCLVNTFKVVIKRSKIINKLKSLNEITLLKFILKIKAAFLKNANKSSQSDDKNEARLILKIKILIGCQ